MTRTLELPEPVYDSLIETASISGLSPADWIAAKLPRSRPDSSPEEREDALRELLSHCVSLGHPTGIDNERIDADLAREYGDDHNPKPAGS